MVPFSLLASHGQLVDLQPPAVIAFHPASTTTDALSSTSKFERTNDRFIAAASSSIEHLIAIEQRR